MRPPFALLIIGFAFIGCTSSYMVSTSPNKERLSFVEFNDDAKNESAKVVFQNDSTVYGEGVVAGADTTVWTDPSTRTKIVVPTRAIRRIVLRNRLRGTLEGAGIGVGSGIIAGLVGAVIWVGSPHDLEGLAYIVLPVIGGTVGLFTGTIIGVIGGHAYEYEFLDNPKPVTPNPPACAIALTGK